MTDPQITDQAKKVMNQIADEIRAARSANDIQRAAHFAGVSRRIIDPAAPVPPPIEGEPSNIG